MGGTDDLNYPVTKALSDSSIGEFDILRIDSALDIRP